MRVVIVVFQDNTDIAGVKYLHAYITSKGYNSSVLILPDNEPRNINAAIDYIVRADPDVVGFSAMSYDFKRAENFAKSLKQRFYEYPFVFGGVHATADPESCLETADIAVRGEGEETFLALLEAVKKGNSGSITQISGIVLKDNNKIIHTPVRQPVVDLDALPFPGHLPDNIYVVHRAGIRSIKEKAVYKRYARYEGVFLSIATSRGCPFSCNYCSNSMYKALYGNNSVRSRSVDSVISEIKAEVGGFKNILYVNFTDDCFLMHPAGWLDEFSRSYAGEINIPFVARATPRHINRENISLLKKAGLRWIFMGLQTGSDRVNKEVYGRSATAQDFLEAAKLIREFRISPWYDVILDNPYETEEDKLMTIDVLLGAKRPFQLGIFSLDYFPGTELLRRVNAEKIPVPKLGEKSYTKFESSLINYYVRMTASLPKCLVRKLVKMRNSLLGKQLGILFYCLTLFIEPFIYVWLVFQSNDFRFIRSFKVIKSFYRRSIAKLFFRDIA